MNRRDFTISDLLGLLKRYWWAVLIGALLVGSVFALISIQNYEPVYKSSVTFFVAPPTDSDDDDWSSTSGLNKLNWSLRMISSYAFILQADDFSTTLDTIFLKENPEDYQRFEITQHKIHRSISISYDDNTSLFTVTYSADSSEAAYALAHAIEELVPDYIENVTNYKNTVRVADTANEPRVPSNSRNLVRNTFIGGVIGAVAVYLIFFFIELFDVRVKSEEDILNNYNVPLIGTIPDYSEETKSRQGN